MQRTPDANGDRYEYGPIARAFFLYSDAVVPERRVAERGGSVLPCSSRPSRLSRRFGQGRGALIRNAVDPQDAGDASRLTGNNYQREDNIYKERARRSPSPIFGKPTIREQIGERGQKKTRSREKERVRGRSGILQEDQISFVFASLLETVLDSASIFSRARNWAYAMLAAFFALSAMSKSIAAWQSATPSRAASRVFLTRSR